MIKNAQVPITKSTIEFVLDPINRKHTTLGRELSSRPIIDYVKADETWPLILNFQSLDIEKL